MFTDHRRVRNEIAMNEEDKEILRKDLLASAPIAKKKRSAAESKFENGGDGQGQSEVQGEEGQKIEDEAAEFFPVGSKIPPSGSSRPSSLWLVTFTDVMALMLTFFVLLYSMSTPDVDKWEDMTRGISSGISKFAGAPKLAGNQDTISIERLSAKKGLNLKYLGSLVYGVVTRNEDLSDVLLFHSSDQLIISMPSELLFDSERSDVSLKGRRALFTLNELFVRIRNRVEIIGHSEPNSVFEGNDGIKNNREFSLARAVYVAAALEEVGYDRPIVARGLSDTRYDELGGVLSQDKRLALSRRVDIVIMKDEGSYRGFMP